jgi:hypothetical protein
MHILVNNVAHGWLRLADGHSWLKSQAKLLIQGGYGWLAALQPFFGYRFSTMARHIKKWCITLNELFSLF